MAYDQLGMAVGGAMQDIGMQLWRDKRAKKAYEEDLARKAQEDEKRYQMELERIEKSELAKSEREAAREQARAERDAAADARKHQYAMELEDKRGASREKAAGIRNSRPLMAREDKPSYDKAVNRTTGKQRYIKRGEELGPDEEFYVPRGDRRTSRPVMAQMESVAGPLAKMAGAFASGSPSAPEAAPAQAKQSPAPSKSPYPDGTRLQGPDGRMYVVRNGEPVPE